MDTATVQTCLSIQEFARMIGRSRSTARRIVLEHKLVDYVQVGNCYAVPLDSARMFLEHHTHKAERFLR